MVAEMRRPSEPSDWSRVRVLEIGCGTGELSFELLKLTGAQITGVDLSASFISQARGTYPHPGLNFLVVDLNESVPEFESSAFHYIVGNGILHHLYDQLGRFLARLERGLVPGGKLIFWEPNLFNPYILSIFTIPFLRRLACLEPEEMAFTPSFIARQLSHAGFYDVRAVPRDFLLPHTPTSCIDMVVKLGDRLERLYGVRALAQSVFVTATKRRSAE